jgi:uncharacterized repeat protein (TIGR01451 family)
MALLDNQSAFDFELCGKTITLESNEVKTQIVDFDDITITKSASCAYAIVGKNLCYTIVIKNDGDVGFADVLFRDQLAGNTEYVTDSFTVNNISQTPTIVNNEIQYELDIPANSTTTIKFCVKVLGK